MKCNKIAVFMAFNGAATTDRTGRFKVGTISDKYVPTLTVTLPMLLQKQDGSYKVNVPAVAQISNYSHGLFVTTTELQTTYGRDVGDVSDFPWDGGGITMIYDL